MTVMFLVVILGATDKRAPQGFAPIAIGLCLTLIHLISIPVTNTSVNPARSTGVAVFVGGWALSTAVAVLGRADRRRGRRRGHLPLHRRFERRLNGRRRDARRLGRIRAAFWRQHIAGEASMIRRTLLIAGVLCSGSALGGELFRCGSWVVSADMSVAEFKAKCGEPTRKTVETQDVYAHAAGGGTIKTGTTKVERWVYDRRQSLLQHGGDDSRRRDHEPGPG